MIGCVGERSAWRCVDFFTSNTAVLDRRRNRVTPFTFWQWRTRCVSAMASFTVRTSQPTAAEAWRVEQHRKDIEHSDDRGNCSNPPATLPMPNNRLSNSTAIPR
jgi:hypothetical protein